MTQNERLFSPEIQAAFGDWIKLKGIEVVLFDLDDTLINTNTVFVNQIAAFFDFAATNVSGLDLENFKKRFRELENEAFDQIGISPKHWDYILEALEIEHGEVIASGRSVFEEIYNTSPEILDGTEETLKLCKKVGLKIGLVTHAGEDWTDIKLNNNNLRQYFDHINVIDPTVHKRKGSAHWRESITFFGVDINRVMVVGDNLSGDIMAAHEIGIKTLVWIPSSWHKYNEGKLPVGVYQVDKIGNMIETLIQNK